MRHASPTVRARTGDKRSPGSSARLAHGLTVLLGLALGGACGTPPRAALPPASVAPSPLPAPPSPASTSTSTTEPIVTPQTSPDAAAGALIEAWQRDDRALADHLGSPGAVGTLFQLAKQPTAARGCQDPLAGSSLCAFMYGTTLLQLQTIALGGGWTVQSASVNQD